MEEQKVMSHIVKGIIGALLLIVLGLIGYFGGLTMQGWFSWASDCILIGFIIWGCIYYSNQKKGQVTFGNVFAHGFKISAIIALILIVYTIISITLIFPETKEKAMELARQKMEERGNMTGDEMDKALDISNRFFLPITIGAVLLGTLIFGAIASLVGAAVAKKQPVNPTDQLNL